MGGKRWSEEEIDYLENNWGQQSINAISQKIKRSESSIMTKIHRLNVGSFSLNSSYIGLNILINCIYGNYPGGAKVKQLIDNGLKVVNKKINKGTIRMVNIDDFWQWAEDNQHLLNFKNFEENILGKEPSWVKEKRKRDFINYKKYNSYGKWSSEDLDKLMKYKELGFSLLKMAEELGRSTEAVRRKMYDCYMI